MEIWNDLTLQQFQLVYFGRMSFRDVDEMSIIDRKRMYNLLRQTKDEEKKAQENATK
ncbi:hypothetical protein HSE3_gp075 [Bacillus phage vB_BceM-HSE3]|nr:hypothetical protein HSE3_gp075 [Bacillus phage vB_BceM-HSE3]